LKSHGFSIRVFGYNKQVISDIAMRYSRSAFGLAHHISLAMNIVPYLVAGLLLGLVLQSLTFWLLG
jgi:hypothetical protein